jgi:hypothetical protein
MIDVPHQDVAEAKGPRARVSNSSWTLFAQKGIFFVLNLFGL